MFQADAIAKVSMYPYIFRELDNTNCYSRFCKRENRLSYSEIGKLVEDTILDFGAGNEET